MTGPISSSDPTFSSQSSSVFSTSQTTAAPFTNDQLDGNFFDTQFATQLSTAPSLGAFLAAIKDAQLKFKTDLYKIQYDAPEMHTKFAQNAITELAAALAVYQALKTFFDQATLAAGATNPLISSSNTSGTAVNSTVNAVKNEKNSMNSQVTAYNSAANTLDAANGAGFATTADRDAAIDAYNSKATAYNNEAANYDAKVDAANAAILQYNNDVATENAQIAANNLIIQQQNAQLQALGGNTPLIPLQVPITPASLPFLPHANPESIPLLPHANFTSPVPQATAVTDPPIASIAPQTTPNAPNFAKDYLTPYFITPFANLLAYVTGQRRIFAKLLKEAGLPDKPKEVSKPDAIIDKGNANVSNATGPGGLTSVATGLDSELLNMITSRGLVDQLFTQQNLHTPPEVLDLLQAFSLSITNSNMMHGMLPGISALGDNPFSPKITENAARIAMSLGGLSSLLGSLNANATANPILSLINNVSSYQKANLTDTQKQNLADGLTALSSNTSIKLAVQNLAQETNTPGLLNVLDAALIQTQPQNAGAEFAQVPGALTNLIGTKGQVPIQQLLTQFLTTQLTLPGPNSLNETNARTVASSVAEQVTQGQGNLPPDINALQDQLSAVLGEGASSALTQSLANNIVTFTLAASAKSQLQDHIISQAGPTVASELSDQIIKQLFGFSVNFSGPAIVQRDKDEAGGLSILTALQNNLRILNNKNDSAVAQQLTDDFNSAHRTDKNLGDFLRELIDPGAQLFGVMYEQVRGNIPDKGQKASIDIKT